MGSKLKFLFDIMAITETFQKLVNEDFKTNISIEGYLTFSTPTNTNKGGAMIYVNNSFDIIESLYLNVTWIEIKNKKVRINLWIHFQTST